MRAGKKRSKKILKNKPIKQSNYKIYFDLKLFLFQFFTPLKLLISLSKLIGRPPTKLIIQALHGLTNHLLTYSQTTKSKPKSKKTKPHHNPSKAIRKKISPVLQAITKYSIWLKKIATKPIFLPKIKLPPLPTLPLPTIKIPKIKKVSPTKIFLVSFLSFAVTTAAVAVGLFFFLHSLPDPRQLRQLQPKLTTKIYDRHGTLLYKIYKDENRSLVDLADIPPETILATIAIEDQDFYQHLGFSVRGIARAFRSNLSSNSIEGGSTITQQLIKNTLLTSERTWQRKIKELTLSVITEFYFTKDEILTMYFNQVPYGGTAYGIEEASQMYFDKPVGELSLAESAFLAGLPAAPTKFSPYGNQPELATLRQTQVLSRMLAEGYIDQFEFQLAKQAPIQIASKNAPILAPHFVMYVRDQLAKEYGQEIVDQGGLDITTSLDLGLQNMAQDIVTNEVQKLKGANVNNGAALITNPNTGEILAMVGSVDFFDSSNDGQVNVTLRNRQPGSSIKPVTYAMAFSNGLSPATLVQDDRTCFQDPHQPDYCPVNYDGKFHGRVTLRQALANSYNVSAVKLLNQFGVDKLLGFASNMGISTWQDTSRFGLSLTLGGGEVKMVDMAVVYGTFANSGKRINLQPIISAKTANGRQLIQDACTDNGCSGIRVLDPRVAYQITNVLSDNQARSNAFGTNSLLNIPGQQVAVKTGTTNDFRDNWAIGYTTDRVVVVWVGNNDNQQMRQIASGLTGATPIWNQLTSLNLDTQTPHNFTAPQNLTKVSICSLTGTLSCTGCPSVEEYFIPGTEPKTHCSAEQITQKLAKIKSQQLQN